MKSLRNYILTLLAEGKYFFSKQEVLSALKLSQNQLRFQAYRLSKKKIVKRLTEDFFMIIPPEYYHLGSLPPHWIINAFMKHLNQEYYIGLLSAASFYGATEQQPMIFQVITTKPTKSIDLERATIEFHKFKYCDLAMKSTITTPTGYAKISNREQTIIDLVRFYKVSGYLSNVSLVIQSLAAECDLSNFAHAVRNEKNKSALQRLGYILELMQFGKLAQVVENELLRRTIEYVFLRPDFHNKIGKKATRWKLILNDSVEIS